jgi:gamma-glutamyltranspeptidase/glutathione hydrolase
VAGGVVAAGHPLTAEAGARVLRAGGNAVDAALGAMLASFACEPLLTGLGAGGYLLVAGFDPEPVLLDFFVEAPGARRPGPPGAVLPVLVDFGGATQTFNCGGAPSGTWGRARGRRGRRRRVGQRPARRARGARRRARARRASSSTPPRAFISELLEGSSCPRRVRGGLRSGGRALREGDAWRWPDSATRSSASGAEGAAPFYAGEVGTAVARWLADRGGIVTREDLATYAAIGRTPIRSAYRGRTVLTNPPPNAGGILVAAALRDLDATPSVSPARLVDVMEAVQAGRTPAFVAGLDEPGYAERFLAGRLGSTTHISVLDGEGRAATVTCTNGEGCGVVVPGTGMHPNNIMGEEDLNPLGLHRFPPGRRMPSMMAPSVMLDADGRVELALGSAGSNRIRSALLQVIVGVVDHGLQVADAVRAPRLHFEDGVVYAEPGIDVDALAAAGRTVSPFRERNLFFGGVAAVRRDPDTGLLGGAGDPRRGGAAVRA